MNAWLESGCTNTFVGVLSNDVVFRTSTQSNTLIFGNGSNPTTDAAMYVSKNCIGINRLPCATQSIALDIDGMVVSRSNITWCEQGASTGSIVAGSNTTRICALGVAMHDGTRNTLSMARDGTITTIGSVKAVSGVFGSSGISNAQVPVLSVEGRGDFRDGLSVSFTNALDNVSDSTFSYDHVRKSLAIGSRATIDTKGLAIKGSITSSGHVFAPSFKVLSDVRMKENVISSDSLEDLASILALDVKRYNLIDNGVDRSKSGQTGILAHELRRVIPNALSTVSDYLPNIMVDAHVHSHVHFDAQGPTWLVFPSSTPSSIRNIICIGDNIRLKIDGNLMIADVVDVCMNDDQSIRQVCVLGSEENRRVLHGSDINTRVFIFGTLCDDIMAIDTAQVIFRLVSAIQALHAEVRDLKSLHHS